MHIPTSPPSFSHRNKVRRWRKWHKWFGLFFSFFLVPFIVSGILLNHRETIKSIDVSRSWLPADYRLKNWNQGTVRGTLRLGPDRVLLYGENGAFLSDDALTEIRACVEGLPGGAERRSFVDVARTSKGALFGVTPYDVYSFDPAREQWRALPLTPSADDRFTSAAVSGDTLVVQSRSLLYVAVPPYRRFEVVSLSAPQTGAPGRLTLRTVWRLHSGELFGTAGRLCVDVLGLALLALCVTGLVLTFSPRWIRRFRASRRRVGRFSRFSLRWHNRIGVVTLVFVFTLTLTGMFLRPPLLIGIAGRSHAPLPFTAEDSPNAWWDELRMLRRDTARGEWLLYTAHGFYVTPSLFQAPRRLASPPPTGVMGPNVLRQVGRDEWLVGSFAGLFRWHRPSGGCYDLTRDCPYVAPRRAGIPDFTHSVSGYSDDFRGRPLVFDYNRGVEYVSSVDGSHRSAEKSHLSAKTSDVSSKTSDFSVSGSTSASAPRPMPPMSPRLDGRMSLWRLALEVHTGRIYTFLPRILVQLFIFLSGLFFLSVLISGYVVYRRVFSRRKLVNPK